MFIAYIYDINNEVIAQVEEVLDVDIQKKLNDVWTASFSLYHTNEYCKRQYLKEYRRVVINKKEWNTEKSMFDGVIRWFEADLEKTSIKLETFEHYFERRILHDNFTFSSQTIDNILTTLLNDINIRYNTRISLDCWISQITNKEYKKWETFLKVLQDLSDLWYEFVIENMILKFKNTIWENKTTWENFIEYKYDINEPDDRSIDGVKVLIDGKELANWVIWKSWSDYTTLSDATSIWEFGLIETSFTTSWDDANSTQSFLDDHKESLTEYQVDARSDDFFETSLWDMVKVFVFVWNDIMFLDWEMKVIWKQYTGGDLPQIKVFLWNTKIKSKTIIDQMVEMQKQIKTLLLQ